MCKGFVVQQLGMVVTFASLVERKRGKGKGEGWIGKQEPGILVPYNPCSRFQILFESQPIEGSKVNLAYVISCHV